MRSCTSHEHLIQKGMSARNEDTVLHTVSVFSTASISCQRLRIPTEPDGSNRRRIALIEFLDEPPEIALQYVLIDGYAASNFDARFSTALDTVFKV